MLGWLERAPRQTPGRRDGGDGGAVRIEASKEREAAAVVVMVAGGSGNNGQRNAPVQKNGKSVGYGLLPLLAGGVLSLSRALCCLAL
jgi:hypothetical protein